MADFADTSNMALRYWEEPTLGANIPPGQDFDTLRFKSQSLEINEKTAESEEINDDALTDDIVVVDADPAGAIEVEFSYGNADKIIDCALGGAGWQDTPALLNTASGTPIAGIAAAAITTTSVGAASKFKAGHLVLLTGAGAAANEEKVARVSGTSGATIQFPGGTFTAEASPPAGMSIKVVGFAGTAGTAAVAATGSIALTGTPSDGDTVTISDGVTPVTFEFSSDGTVSGANIAVTIGVDEDESGDNLRAAINLHAFGITASGTGADIDLENDTAGAAGNSVITKSGAVITVTGMSGGTAATPGDVVATATGLASTTLDFTTLGLPAGAWMKVGGSDPDAAFATASMNGWAKAASITAHAIEFAYKPPGWGIASPAGGIRVWFGDTLKNGKAVKSLGFQREHNDIGEFFYYPGFCPNTMTIQKQNGQIMPISFEFMGMGERNEQASFVTGAVLPPTSGAVFSTSTDIPHIFEGGDTMGTLQSLTFKTTQNLRSRKAIGVLGNAGIGRGKNMVTLEFRGYFANGSLKRKSLKKLETDVAFVARKLDGVTGTTGQGYVFNIDRAKVTAKIDAGAVNTDCMMSGTFTGLKKGGTAVTIHRFPYFEQ